MRYLDAKPFIINNKCGGTLKEDCFCTMCGCDNDYIKYLPPNLRSLRFYNEIKKS